MARGNNPNRGPITRPNPPAPKRARARFPPATTGQGSAKGENGQFPQSPRSNETGPGGRGAARLGENDSGARLPRKRKATRGRQRRAIKGGGHGQQGPGGKKGAAGLENPGGKCSGGRQPSGSGDPKAGGNPGKANLMSPKWKKIGSGGPGEAGFGGSEGERVQPNPGKAGRKRGKRNPRLFNKAGPAKKRAKKRHCLAVWGKIKGWGKGGKKGGKWRGNPGEIFSPV